MLTKSDLSNLQFMELHLNTLFRCDPDGRLRCVNEHGDPPAPRFFMGRTPQGNFWRFRYDLPAGVVEQLDALCQSEPITADLASTPQNYAAIKAVLAEYAPIQDEYRGPAYWIPEGNSIATNAVLIAETNAELLRTTFSWLLPLVQATATEPIAVAVEQDKAVAVCFCSRIPNRATEAGLETLEAFRGKGYATAVVAAWSAAVRRLGCIPLYSTSWDNLASQGVARKLGMRLYGEDWSLG
jgi:RimJ/RimL family protein N-acetyltransferase